MIERRDAFDLPRIAGYVFMGFGALIAAVGGLIAIDDPAGFFAILFGLVFIGVGYLARRLAVPKDMKEVAVSGHMADVVGWDGRSGTRSQATVIHVAKDATEAEVAAAREAWLREQWSKRPDWAEGLIRSDDVKYGSLAYWAAGIWAVFALGALGAALIWGDVAWLVLAGALPVAAAFITGAIRLALRRRKFAESRLALAHTPVAVGGKLEGEVRTGVPRNVQLREGFTLTLRCVYRWEERSGSGDNRQTRVRRDTLWETQSRHPGRVRSGSPTLVVPISADLPAGQPAAAIDSTGEGILWELSVTAALPGIDYHAAFELPVFDVETAEALRRPG
ncbi:MAG: hypothetical protein HY526_02140 [Betaproteobacteria bacterium]|nr:hypothetical protein [Betaproteobacteria bacterium]